MTIAHLLHHAVCGAIAAAGFGVLFNVARRLLPWCAATGALALAVRTGLIDAGWSLEAASFVAAIAVGAAVHLMRRRTGAFGDLLDVTGCIPMVPGSFAARALIGLFALTTSKVAREQETLIIATQYTLRVIVTIGAIGTGLAIPTYLMRKRQSR
jgi:uncharacterized membrane protein YjjB (DUF3815 family)